MKNTKHLLPNTAISDGQRKFVKMEDRDIVLFNVRGEIYAIDDSCPHSGASLFNGELDGYRIKCPAHGLSFDIRTGCMKYGAGFNLSTYKCHKVGLDVEVDWSTEK